jgi:hypothetical protein
MRSKSVDDVMLELHKSQSFEKFTGLPGHKRHEWSRGGRRGGSMKDLRVLERMDREKRKLESRMTVDHLGRSLDQGLARRRSSGDHENRMSDDKHRKKMEIIREKYRRRSSVDQGKQMQQLAERAGSEGTASAATVFREHSGNSSNNADTFHSSGNRDGRLDLEAGKDLDWISERGSEDVYSGGAGSETASKRDDEQHAESCTDDVVVKISGHAMDRLSWKAENQQGAAHAHAQTAFPRSKYRAAEPLPARGHESRLRCRKRQQHMMAGLAMAQTLLVMAGALRLAGVPPRTV